MSISTIAQLVSAGTNLLFVIVIAVGYYLMIKLYKQMVAVYDRMLHMMEAQRTAMGRPQVIVDDDYARLPEVDLVVRNMSEGAAKEISFEFSSPIESSDGTVVSELSYFRDGLDFLAPGGKISCYWDRLHSLLPLLEEKGLQEGITVTTNYKDLAGESYSTEWNLNPYLYRDGRYVQRKDVADVARSLEKISGQLEAFLARQGRGGGDDTVQRQLQERQEEKQQQEAAASPEGGRRS
jgi:hypothetical protein